MVFTQNVRYNYYIIYLPFCYGVTDVFETFFREYPLGRHGGVPALATKLLAGKRRFNRFSSPDGKRLR